MPDHRFKPVDDAEWPIEPIGSPIHKGQTKWFNQYICIFEHGVECAKCNKSLGNKVGDIVFSCCPAVYDSFEEAVKDAKEGQDDEFAEYGHNITEYMGTFEVEL